MKRRKDTIYEFFRQIPFMSGLSSKTIVKLELDFEEWKAEKAGHVVLQEGNPVTHIAIVKQGEFEVVKKSVRGLDDKIMAFLGKSDLRKRIASRVLLLPGRSTIFKKTAQLIPPVERSAEE